MPAFVIINIASNATPITITVPINDFSNDFQLGLKYAGPIVAKRATHSVSEYTIQTEVLMAIISPNFANGRIVVCVRGMAAITVVTAELMMDTPIWLNVALVLH